MCNSFNIIDRLQLSKIDHSNRIFTLIEAWPAVLFDIPLYYTINGTQCDNIISWCSCYILRTKFDKTCEYSEDAVTSTLHQALDPRSASDGDARQIYQKSCRDSF